MKRKKEKDVKVNSNDAQIMSEYIIGIDDNTISEQSAYSSKKIEEYVEDFQQNKFDGVELIDGYLRFKANGNIIKNIPLVPEDMIANKILLDIPTKTSELINDAGFITQHQDISMKVDKVDGKELSTNDLTDTLLERIDVAYKHSQEDEFSGDYEDLKNKPAKFVLPKASKTQLGGIKTGDDFYTTEDGALNLKYKIWVGTQAQYNSIGEEDDSTLYFIHEQTTYDVETPIFIRLLIKGFKSGSTSVSDDSLELNKWYEIDYTISPDEAKNKVVTFSCSNPNCTIDNTNKSIMFKDYGSFTIKGEVDGEIDVYYITFAKNVLPTGLNIMGLKNADMNDIQLGTWYQIEYSFIPEDATADTVVFTCSNSNATISGSKIKFSAYDQEYNIKGTCQANGVTGEISIIPKKKEIPMTSITIIGLQEVESPYTQAGLQDTYKQEKWYKVLCSFTPSNATSTDYSVLVASGDGDYETNTDRIMSKGASEIDIQVQSKYWSCTDRATFTFEKEDVSEPEPEPCTNVTINGISGYTDDQLELNKWYDISYSTIPAGKLPTFTSSSSNVIISGTQIKFLAYGTYTITAKVESQTATYNITVTKTETEPEPEPGTENVISALDFYSNEVPSLFVRNFVSRVTKGSNLTLSYYVSDHDQSEYLYNITNKKFTTVVELNGKTIKKTTDAGEQSINLGTMNTVGDYTYCIYTIQEDGVTSFRQYFDFKVVDPITYNTYTMTSNDLSKYSITQGTVSTSVAKSNKTGLTNLFEGVKNAGYNKIVMLKGTYYIDYHEDDIAFPSEFTIDMNGSTIAVTQCTDLNKGYMLNLKDCVETHVTNGIVKGNYQGFDFEATKSTTGYSIPGEGLSCLDIEGSSYCSFSNIDVSGSVGYNLGIFSNGMDLFGQNKDELKFTSDGYIDGSGNLVSRSGLVTTDYVDISGTHKYGEFQVSRLLAYAGCYGDIAEIYVHFYDSSKKYLYTTKSRQYQTIKLKGSNEDYARITAFGTQSALTNKMCIHYLKTSRNCEIRDLTLHDTRTCCMHPGIYENLLIDNCTMTKIATEPTWRVTPLAVDFEDGYENGKNIFFTNNSVSDGAGNLTIQSAFNANVVGNRNYTLDFRSKLKGGFIKDNSFTTGMFFVGEHINQSHIKFINNTFTELRVTAWEEKDTNLPIRFLDGNSWEGDMIINMGAKVIGVNYTPAQGVEPDPVGYYTVTNNLINCSSSNNKTSVQADSSYSTTIYVVGGYNLGNITVTMGGKDITSSVVGSNNIYIPKVTGNIVITCTATSSDSGGNPNNYSITYNLVSCTSSNTSTTITSGSTYSSTISPNSGYTLGSITVTMGGSDVTSSAVTGGYIYIGNVTGNIVITCSATSSSNPGGGISPTYSIDGQQVLAQQYASSHDGYCHGIPTDAYGGFYYKPRINPDGAFPNSDWKATLMWMTSYLEEGKSYYDNVGLRFENPRIYMFDFNKNKWCKLDDTFNWGTWYLENFWNDGNGEIANHVNWDSDKKGVTILQDSATAGRCFHGFTNQVDWRNSSIAHNGTPYIITSIDFKLVKFNSSGADNLSNASLLVNAGCDWWSYVGASWNSDWTSNRDMSVGKYIRATTTMQRAYCTNIPQNWSYGFNME